MCGPWSPVSDSPDTSRQSRPRMSHPRSAWFRATPRFNSGFPSAFTNRWRRVLSHSRWIGPTWQATHTRRWRLCVSRVWLTGRSSSTEFIPVSSVKEGRKPAGIHATTTIWRGCYGGEGSTDKGAPPTIEYATCGDNEAGRLTTRTR